MPQLLTLEWDNHEARLAVASTVGGRVIIEQAFSVALDAAQTDGDETEVEVGGRIAAAMAARGVGRLDTLVAIGRSSIELRQLSLPPAPEDELPDIVRFQAMREFNQFSEDWLLDFVPIGDSAEGQQAVLAAAIDPGTVAQVERICQNAHLKPRRLILRPCAAASLLSRSRPADPGQARVLIDLLSEEADLTVMVDRKVIFLRTARMSRDPLAGENEAGALLGELRRTMAAVQNQLGGQRVGRIILCGQGERHAALAKLIEAELSTPTELFDPFERLDLGPALRRALPDDPGRFAPLLGMALAELEETAHAIDFLHPRRRRPPPSRYKRYAIAGVAAALLVVSFFAFRGVYRSWLDSEAQSLAKEIKSLDELIDKADEKKTAVDAVQAWTAKEINWLEELRELSAEFPPAKQAMLTQLVLASTPAGGKVELEGLVDASEVIGKLEAQLRDGSHRVEGTGSREDKKTNPLYSWWFSESLYVSPEGQ